MESAEVGLCSSKTPPCSPGPAGSQLCGDVQTETCKASGGASVEHITHVDLQKNVKKEESEDEDYLWKALSDSVGHITPVDQQNQIKMEEFKAEETFCGGTSNSVENIDQQNEGFEIKHIKKEESEDEDSLCTATDWARYMGEEALQMALDSDEEFTFSSEEEQDSDEERLYFEQRLDSAEDVIPDESVAASPASCTRKTRECRSSSLENHDTTEPVAKKAKEDKQPTQSWRTETDADMAPQALRFLPAQEPGPQITPCDAHTPMSLFRMFFTESAMSTLCQNTNAQAARARAKGRKYKWTDISISEMYCYIGLLFYMAMVKLRCITDYWRQDSLFSVSFPATIMSRNRYRTISWNVHMSHPDADKDNDRKRGTAEHDRLFRVRPLMDTIRHACKAVYHPRKNLAVGERMVACKANTGMTQYMKAKPTKWGFKLFVLVDSSNGYAVDFAVYTGKNNFPTGHGLSYDAVTSLLDRTFLGSGYHVYMDNFYTSPKLLTDLFALKFAACGTYRDNRKNCPRNAANSLTKKSVRGSIRWIRDEHLLFVKWMDTREVSVCSTIHAAYTGHTVQRRVKTQTGWRTMSLPCPAPVTAYNQHMGGVALSDQLIQYYTTQHKTMKWYRKLFLHFLDIAATNAFIVHKELYGTMNHKEFMEELVAELCGVPQKKVTPKRISAHHVPAAIAGRRTCVLCKAKHGKRLDTPWKCKACDVHLCVQVKRNCFLEWHDDV